MNLNKKKFISVLCVSFFLLFISGCGYKLQDKNLNLFNFDLSVQYEQNSLNNKFINLFKKRNYKNKIYLNSSLKDTDLNIRIIDHKVTRYISAIGSGARAKEARLDYLLVIGLKTPKMGDESISEIKRSKNYSFDESRILAIEQEEEQIIEGFISFALNRFNWLTLELLKKDEINSK